MHIRLATPDDAPAILEIYAHYCLNKPATFELEPPALDEMEKRIRETLLTYPWLVAVEPIQILGYAYASAFRPRKGWQWAANGYLFRGYKGDSWHDVAFFQLRLNSPNAVPKEPLRLSEIADLVF